MLQNSRAIVRLLQSMYLLTIHLDFNILIINFCSMSSDLYLIASIENDDEFTALVLTDFTQPIEKMRSFDFEKFSDQFCWVHFRFYKEDIITLKTLLKIQDRIVLNNRTSVSGLEALCILLKRMSYPNRYVDLMKIFPRSRSEMSRIFNYVVTFLMQNHAQRLRSLTQWFLNAAHLKDYADAIATKGSPYKNCVGFIDGTVRPICRPTISQREYYNGHKRTHALKFQSLILPNGIIGNLFIVPGRRHDAHLLEASGIIHEMEILFNTPQGEPYYIYGDPAYPLRKHLMVPFKGYALTQIQEKCNKMMSSVRESVEWGFCKIVQLFPFLDFKKNLKIGLQQVGNYYTVGTLLTNCHTCFYGSQTSDYFNCQPPTIQEYLQ